MKIIIFGAGQAGVMTARWLPAGQELIGFADNSSEKQGQMMFGVPVFSLEQSLEKQPDRIWIAVINCEAAQEIENQIRDSGFAGEVIRLQTFRQLQDIRLASLRLLAEEIKSRNISGEIAELGVSRGAFAAEMNRLLPDRKLYLFDTFRGFDRRDIEIEKNVGNQFAREGAFSDTNIDVVRAGLPYPRQAVFCPGYFPESLSELACKLPPMALVSLDPDLYAPAYEGLKIFYPLLSSGGKILIHDYNSLQFPGVRKAVDEFCEEQSIYVIPLMDLHGSAVIVKP